MELIHVTKSYNTKGNSITALRDVSLRVMEGSMLCLMGPSGSGKSTLLKVAAGFLPPEEGIVKLLDAPLYELPLAQRIKTRRNIGFMFQDDLLIDTLTLFENIELPLIIEGINRRRRKEIAERIFEHVDLKGKEERRPNEVSGGERRRASLARSLVNEPKVLFADEPTSNLDTKAALNIIKLIEKLNNSGMTIILSTHDNKIAENVDTVISIRDGLIMS